MIPTARSFLMVCTGMSRRSQADCNAAVPRSSTSVQSAIGVGLRCRPSLRVGDSCSRLPERKTCPARPQAECLRLCPPASLSEEAQGAVRNAPPFPGIQQPSQARNITHVGGRLESTQSTPGSRYSGCECRWCRPRRR
eukprot:977729-Prorocentrum_minimum.AAC.2